jgi:molybdate transport system ATP-binding protein
MSLSVDIKKKLNRFELRISFEINGNVLGFLGASGCGKSMTLKCIAGIETPDWGKIVLDDHVLFDSENGINVPPQKRKVGYLFQSYALFPNMTVAENIGMGLFCGKSEKETIVSDKIKTFHLHGLEQKRPFQLSGGQQQRVALARLLASDPDIVLLDEPFSALDSHLKWKLEQELTDVIASFDKTVIMVSHSRDEIYRICDTVAIFDDGKIGAYGGLQDLFKNPETVNGAILTGCKNISRAVRRSDYEVEAIDWGITLQTTYELPHDFDYIGIRAHYFEFANNDMSQNTMDCELIREIDNPFSSIIMLKKKGMDVTDDNALIRFEMEKDKWEEHKTAALKLLFREETFLFLKSESIRTGCVS